MNRRELLLSASGLSAFGLFGLAAYQRPAQAQALWSDDPDEGYVAPTLSPSGGIATLHAHIASPASVDTVVYITANSTGPSASVPQSVTVPAGQTYTEFSLTYGARVHVGDTITINLSSNGGQNNSSDVYQYV